MAAPAARPVCDFCLWQKLEKRKGRQGFGGGTPSISKKAGVPLLFCRDDSTRTSDPYVPNVVRYQLRYIPLFIAFLIFFRFRSVT